MLDLPFRSTKQFAADIRRKKIGYGEPLELYLARVEKDDPALNAIVVRDFGRRGRPRRSRCGRGESFDIARELGCGYCVTVGNKCVYQVGNETYLRGD